MKKQELDKLTLNDWMRDHWNLYASQMYNEKLLRLWTNGNGYYRVTYGDESLYEGSQMTQAFAAWDEV